MNISLDYDDTYTKDPVFWDSFIKLTRNRGHYIFICTCRAPQDISDMILPSSIKIYFTSGQPKQLFMNNLGIRVDVWIDDMPELIVYDRESN